MENSNFNWDTILTIVYDHNKEQNSLRNAIVIAFISLTSIIYEFLIKDYKELTYLLFAFGIMLQVVMARHKFYGNRDLIIISIITKLMPYKPGNINLELIDALSVNQIDAFRARTESFLSCIKKIIYSTDGLIYIILSSFNISILFFNSYQVTSELVLVYFIVSLLVYMSFSIYLFYYFSINNVRKLQPKDLDFIQVYSRD